MADADKQSQEEMEGDGCVTTASSSSALTASSTPRSNTPTGTQPNAIPLGNITSDRQAVQLIQQTLHRPQSMTAQYLQQMYAAQQQHILLQTAALQQQHQQNLTATQILTTTEQAAQTNGRQPTSSPPSSNGNVTQLASVSQTSITMPTSPVTQPIGRIQVTSSNSTAGAISQQAMLLGNSSPTGSQAQMYLRTQMLILTPAATDLTVVSSVSSQSASSQVQSLALRTHTPGALATPQNVQIKPSLQGQTLVCPLPKMSICPLKSTQLSQNLAEGSRSESLLTDVTQPPSAQPLIPPSTFTPVQSHTLVRHQLHCPSGQRVAPHQLFIQQSSTAHRQPIALRVTPHDSSLPPLALQTRTTPTTATVQSQHTEFLSVPSSSNQSASQSAVVSMSTAPPAVLPDPPPLHLGPVLEPVSQYSPLSSPPPLTMALPRLVQPQRLSLHSVQTVAVQSDHMLVSEEELPVSEAVVQLPFQNLPPPQTVAVDLKVQPATQTEAPSATPLLKETGSMDLVKDVERTCPQNRMPTPPSLSPPDEPQGSSDDVTNWTADLDQPSEPSSRSVIRSPEDPTYANSPPPPLLSSAVRSTSRLPPASLPGNPEGRPSQAIVRPHILTHLIEGFVIREGLEPFPVRRTSLETNLQATLPEDRENTESAQDDCLMDADHLENSTDSDLDNPPAEDGGLISTFLSNTLSKYEHFLQNFFFFFSEQTAENLPDVLECEFCGKRGFARTFLRSKRFCSMTCVRRFNVSCKKRLNLFRSEKVGRWPHRPMGKRGRPPGRINGGSRQHFLRQQLQDSHRTNNNQRASNSIWIEREEEEDPPGPMTTRLRLQAEREKEQDREREQSRVESSSGSDCLLDSSPSQWSVEQVCSFISTLPGCHDIAAEFRSQEIDGQALLLLTEDHLMSAMNIKLGPALKICAQINALKEH
ncbi:polyhomeotic-like protein 3 isoform X4 [Cyprinus carpio]|uniref:Polyhomeotic-like protein 3 isoform X4 n=1 Tax=Cyprinus carpio TaxID=7962 RepID=A0A9Q9ZUQ0_CYPCA|nr:polyhomeotic-like protein 3 isoform X4 [Cyprinus carpio]XP_042574552.1 polyhomeotic-like protein 3 isoform X4 [Cyprinus carpio]XP_042574553.1 polyhomeotic-like protein 3 isoform X4 [Cyprinus carpio]